MDKKQEPPACLIKENRMQSKIELALNSPMMPKRMRWFNSPPAGIGTYWRILNW
jgi:hypothetical protein